MNESVRLAALDDFPDGRGVRVDVGKLRLAVFRVGADVYAIGDRCSHAEASLAEGDVFDHEVECPRHGSAFDIRTGVPNALPATRPVPVYDVSVVDGDVFLSIDVEEASV